MNEQFEIKNAVIESARFDTERGLSAWLYLFYGKGGGQGFGGHLLYAPKGWRAHNTLGDFTGHWIYRVFQIAEVDDWSKLKGRTIRVKSNDGCIKAIGHIVNDDWFDPAKEFEELRNSIKL